MNQPAPLYYLHNFNALINTVYSLYDDLITNEERHFYQCFSSLNTNAQALLVRLLSRKGAFFRTQKLRYNEISDIPRAIDILLGCEFIFRPLTARIEELFPVFTKAEWLKVINEKGLHACKKDVLKGYLSEGDDLLPAILAASCDNLIKLNCRDIFNTYKLLFFGNGRQDLTDFITRDLGVFRYEDYLVHKQSRFFNSRQQLDNMLHYYAVQEEFQHLKAYNTPELVSLLSRLPDLQAAGGESYVDKLLNRRIQGAYIQIARQLERLGSLDTALSIYRLCDLPPSRERQVRILHKLRESDQLNKLCKAIILDGSEAEKRVAKQFIAKFKQTDKASSKAYKPPFEVFELKQSEQRVELALAAHLSKHGACFYVENQLFLSLFGLVFWPTIFADVQGAFTHKFQYKPHDLSDVYFTDRRKKEISQGWRRLEKWLAQPDLALAFFNKKQGIANPFVTWVEGLEQVLTLALQNIPANHFEVVFQRLWSNLKENSSGFPDLVLFPKEGGYTLIEVKGPGDRVQSNQARWFEYFAEHGIPHKVAGVVWLD
ncbi:MAG: VRR-NUC domain-containing protein [Cellvibrionaceae bacterium]|nr:VRR-NUC domain-containing protein [Cellvibrionaceae bacterium]